MKELKTNKEIDNMQIQAKIDSSKVCSFFSRVYCTYKTTKKYNHAKVKNKSQL